jgi:hypothetical protein
LFVGKVRRGVAVKIRRVAANNRKRAFEVRTSSKTLWFPHSEADPPSSLRDRIRCVFVDQELAREAFTYELQSSRFWSTTRIRPSFVTWFSTTLRSRPGSGSPPTPCRGGRSFGVSVRRMLSLLHVLA